MGNSDTFAVYLTGRRVPAGEESVQSVVAEDLGMFNEFSNNVVYSTWGGDSTSLALMGNLRVRNNVMRGGRCALYMLNDTIVTGNHVLDSVSQGFYIALPSSNLYLGFNTVRNATYAGITVAGEFGTRSSSRRFST